MDVSIQDGPCEASTTEMGQADVQREAVVQEIVNAPLAGQFSEADQVAFGMLRILQVEVTQAQATVTRLVNSYNTINANLANRNGYDPASPVSMKTDGTWEQKRS